MLLQLLDSLVVENEHAVETGDPRRSGLQDYLFTYEVSEDTPEI